MISPPQRFGGGRPEIVWAQISRVNARREFRGEVREAAQCFRLGEKRLCRPTEDDRSRESSTSKLPGLALEAKAPPPVRYADLLQGRLDWVWPRLRYKKRDERGGRKSFEHGEYSATLFRSNAAR